jgi:anti-anti-sigma factor
VGGDYYDFVVVDEDTLGVVVADVSGKGVPGSLVMTMIRTALRMEARGNYSANRVMSNMNDFVTDDMKRDMFVTVFYVILDSKNRVISYASAGHNPMILYRAESEETFFLNPRGFPVGISLPDDDLFSRSIDVEKVKLKKDDMLIIYTDGVTEAMNNKREQFGEERLIECIKDGGKLPPQEFIDLLTKRIKEFTGDEPQNDDITVVAIKEKLMADDVLFGIRKKLLDLVELGGLTVAEACNKMNVSPSTYYRYRRRLRELGEEGLKNKKLRKEHEIKRLSYTQRMELLSLIEKHPEYGAKSISQSYDGAKEGEEHLSPSLIYQELKRMRLNNYQKRIDYLRRKRLITEERYEELRNKRPVYGKRMKEELEGVSSPEEASGGFEKKEDEKRLIELPAAEGEMGREREALGKPVMARDSSGDLDEIMGEEKLAAVGIEVKYEELENGIVLLRISGNLDSSSAEDLEEMLERIYNYGITKIVVDLSNVSYISSGGWGIFTGRVKTLREGRGDVVLVGMSPEVYDIYELLGFRDVIMHFQTVDEGIEYISLPFETRNQKIKERAGERDIREGFKHRLESHGEIQGYQEQDDQESWTPLVVQAGTVGKRGEITVLYLHGVVDTVSSIKLSSIMDELIDSGKIKMVIDMSRVEYVSSSGWGVFSSRIEEVREKGGDIKVFGMTREVGSIFELLGFDVVIKSFSVLLEAIDDFEQDTIPVIEKSVARAKEKVSHIHSGVEEHSSELKDNWDYITESNEWGESSILRIQGAVDASTASNLERYFERAIQEKVSLMVIDLSDTVYISSSGWGLMVKYFHGVTETGGKMALAGMNDSVFRIFCDLGFEPLLPNYINTEDALQDLVPLGGGEYSGKGNAHGPKRGEGPREAGVLEVGEIESETTRKTDQRDEEEERSMESSDDRPIVDRADLKPILDEKKEGPDDSVVYLNFEEDRVPHEDKNKDNKIKKLGWEKYGEKLSRRNRRKNDSEE